MRKAKIIATLGPASNTVDKIKRLIKAGINVARVNMSHGTHESHAKLIKNIRQASKEVGIEIGVLIDLQGPKIRTDKLPKNLILKKGEEWVIGPSKLKDNYPEYSERFIPTVYEKLVDDCHDGARILFDDGLMITTAICKDRDVYKIKIETGGELKSNKGINLPDCEVSISSFSEKDRLDLLFALDHDIDYIALSFVRKKDDIQELKELLHSFKNNIPIIAKIENPQAMTNLDEILEVADIIMVARGDMGVEVGNHLVPHIQKKIINKCNQKGIPVITATQMLESMTTNPTPTRAEASDVANAIWDGTDAVMLSGETANGLYPIETVLMMNSIIADAEINPKVRPLLRDMNLENVNSSVMVAASMIAEKIFAKKILAVSETGHSCFKISSFRPITEVLGVTRSLKAARMMSLLWGVNPYYIDNYNPKTFDFDRDVVNILRDKLGLINGDKLVVTRGDGKLFRVKGLSNSIKVKTIRDKPKPIGKSTTSEESEDENKKIILDLAVCVSCQNCIDICPHDIWTMDDEYQIIKLELKRLRFPKLIHMLKIDTL